ncbi:putative pterin-4-alpha-carbinolamine dehydratase [Amylibacter marinus]|uniref:Putative pterin-4-alpha-carbinolamine dehydratase n=1 Tax=Amylibacter marinus TaxID=1475483 RepID=A0ABQ5VYK4_9RHOB|nr:4a-hydroxytetrahydrobiopterin dehydratase [Amylibacter marinus]GLQ36355.1 putative pterin-4-alpha-carbinolamine dehydratase [Amylibacter marinus]
MTSCSIADRSCEPCSGGTPALTPDQASDLYKELQEGWVLSADSKMISRRFTFKGFAKAVYLTNLCVWLADQEGHHPDLSLGWGYTEVTLTTHEIEGLSENDFVWAAKLDRLLG